MGQIELSNHLLYLKPFHFGPKKDWISSIKKEYLEPFNSLPYHLSQVHSDPKWNTSYGHIYGSNRIIQFFLLGIIIINI